MKKIIIVTSMLFMGTLLSAQNLKIAVGAGYKKPVSEVLPNLETTDKAEKDLEQIFEQPTDKKPKKKKARKSDAVVAKAKSKKKAKAKKSTKKAKKSNAKARDE